MQHRDQRLQFARTEPRLEPLDRLRRQRNFRHQHNRALALFQRVRDGLQINFRLAAAGDAVEKKSRGCEDRRWTMAILLACASPIRVFDISLRFIAA